MRLILAFTLVLAATVPAGATLPQPSPATAQSCTGLLRLVLPSASITSAQVVAAGAFTPSAPGSGLNAFTDLPCRVGVPPLP
jgi:hypothetical protein